ncbi:(d)CMP kinase [Pleomorphomonas diazotrophica]|uniref:Cytidylate kinase n=1 Tax=Pleomorphomonas diazotrophica TaxID=1166257 RepID=A0A1I4SRW6_9HYPH|nr:(d)CMP kinase [Pleomorphomonas diazotrophica]PKR88495.1 (d)CMP kinase [Pleomorphomonas diazotrophica]SFM67246.1 cytidylate kinase [Pleomorphomonas diazotrophica]
MPEVSDVVLRKPLLIAIDGPAAAGKGTLAQSLANRLNLPYLDTGLLYRAIGKLMQIAGLDLDDPQAATVVAEKLTPDDLRRGDLRGREAGELASRVAVHSGVRAALVAFQRDFAHGPRGAVLDGRDIGTVICPDADVKLYVTASAEVRARRRTDELLAKGRMVDYEAILSEVKARDERDSGRAEAPLRPADDAIVIDTSALGPAEVLATALAVIENRPAGA